MRDAGLLSLGLSVWNLNLVGGLVGGGVVGDDTDLPKGRGRGGGFPNGREVGDEGRPSDSWRALTKALRVPVLRARASPVQRNEKLNQNW